MFRMDMNTFSQLFLLMLALGVGTQIWLILRQMKHVKGHRAAVPEAFSDSISLEAHQLAADYTLAKTRVGMVELVYGTLLILLWTLGGGLDWVDRGWAQLGWEPLYQGIAFMLSIFLLMGLLDLPFGLYRTFVIEERFGFNRMTAALYLNDMVKQFLLLLVIGTPLAALVLWLMGNAGPNWWLSVWAVWMGFSLLMLWAFPTFIAPLFNKFEPLEDQDTVSRIEALLERCGFKSNGIFMMDGSRRSAHGNAYFTGMGNNKRIVFFDTLLKQLNIDEVEAVLAHELGHFRHKHVRKRFILMAASSFIGLAILGWLIQQDWFYQGLGVSTPSVHIALILFLLVMPIFTFFIQPILAYGSRKHEFEADAFAAQHTDAEHLIHALVKMYEENASTLTPDPLYSAFHDSHPPAPVRIAQLSKQTAATMG